MEPKKKAAPFTRDWLREAYLISKGDAKLKIKREHVQVCVEAIETIKIQSENLRKLMKYAYEQACLRRQEMGLPPPPAPPGLDLQ